MAKTLRTRADLASLPAYKAGQKLQARDGLQVFKLSSNENPYPPLPSVVDAIIKASSDINRYPDPLNTEMINAIAHRYEVNPLNIGVGTGSVAVLGHIIESMVAPDEEVMFAWRSFEAYPIWVQICSGRSVQVPLTQDFGHDFDAMLAAITERTRVIFVCTPNNPTGTGVDHDELDAFISKVPEDILVVIDEAYGEFIRDKKIARGIELFNKYPNVAVLRTFSKAYGLAGLRIGFVIAPEEIADYVRRTSIPFGVSGVAQAAVVASLEPAAEAELLHRVDAIVEERERVLAEVRAQGWNVPAQHANFFWLPTERVDEIRLACEAAGVAVRPFPEGLRITIGETEANNRIIETLGKLAQS
jgi:histidinol-phosphate aminotransferase